MDKIAETSLLYDFYGQLLTEKQRQVMGLYHEENLSLTEIADEFMISRQAVHDTLKKAERSLAEYENKLGLVEKFVRTNRAMKEIEREIDKITGAIAMSDGAVDAAGADGAVDAAGADGADDAVGAVDAVDAAGEPAATDADGVADADDTCAGAVLKRLQRVKSIIEALEEE